MEQQGMPVPEWAGELSEEMSKRLGDTMSQAVFKPRDMSRITDYTTFFGEWTIRDNDIIMHFFPRNGPDDKWTEGHYINRCRNCRAEIRGPVERAKLIPCERCGHTGLVYVPGRQEEKSDIQFPDGAGDVLKKSVDKAWEGDVAIEFLEELGAYVVQLQGIGSLPTNTQDSILVKICDEFDRILDKRRKIACE